MNQWNTFIISKNFVHFYEAVRKSVNNFIVVSSYINEYICIDSYYKVYSIYWFMIINVLTRLIYNDVIAIKVILFILVYSYRIKGVKWTECL